MKSTRIPGHALISEGAAHDADGRRLYCPNNSGGSGRALCSCGALSEVLPSGAARKRWHALVHKPVMVK